MKNNRNFYAFNLILAAMLSLTFGLTARAQSTDIDNPTALTANVIEGEGDGKAETFYYSFTATKGDVKITVDAKTDYYSTPFKVTLMDEDGKELLPIYFVAKDTGQREVKTKRFVRETKVIVRISLEKDDHLKLLTYKIKLDGAVKVETPPAAVESTPATEQTNPTTEQTTNSTAPTTDSPTTTADSPATTEGEKKKTNPKLKDKIKKKVKDATKKTVKDIVDN